MSAADIASALGQHPPTPEQTAVIEAPLAPLLVVAGAGSGKTETMAARVVWLVANGLVEPERVLGLTFTRKAAGELAERVRLRLAALDRAGLLPLPAASEIPGTAEGPRGSGAARAGGAGEASPTVATYHAYAAGLVTDHGLRIGVEPRSQLIGPAAAWQLAADVVDSADGTGADGLGDLDAAPSTVVTAVLALAGECAEHLVDVDAVDATLAAVVQRISALPGKLPAPAAKALAVLAQRRRVLPLLRRYAERKRELGVLDHGDQVRLAARIAAEVPAVAALERARWGVVLLDEYQDTSTAQAELLSRLFGGGHPVTAVGDPHQAIYGWRGASAGGLQAFPTRFRRSDGAAAAHLALSTSWRNDVAVLDAAAVVAQPLRAASRLPLPVLGPRPGAGDGRVEVAWAQTAGEEAALLADRIAVVWHADARLPADQRRTAAVLCRARSQFPLLEEALRARGVPVEVVGLGGLLLRPEVVDVVSALRAVADPTRGDAVVRLLTGPRWRLGARDLAVLAAWSRRRATSRRSRAEASPDGQPSSPELAEEASLVDAVDDPPPADWETADAARLSEAARERVREAGLLLRRLRELDLPLADLVVAVERALLLDVELAARASLDGSSPAAARAGLDALAEVAASFTAATGAGTSHRSSLRAFLAWLALAEEHEHGLDQASTEADDPVPGLGDGGEEGTEPSRSAVQLLTVHASKGLEWDVVAVAGLAENGFPTRPRTSQGWLSGLGVLPHPLRGDADSLPHLGWEAALDAKGAEAERAAYAEQCAHAHRAEERRLAYVALTRARSLLLLSGAWWGGERKKERLPSAFLVEVVEHLRALAPGHGGSADEVPELPEAPEEAENPELREPRRASWPFDPLGPRRPALEAAAAAVREAAVALAVDDGAAPQPHGAGGPWAEEVEALLAERARGDAGGSPDVELPAHLSASRLVQLAADPAALALAVRRPVPVQPRVATRRGVAFHAWLEERFRSAALLDVDELLGPDAEADDLTDGDGLGPLGADEEELAALQASFLASEWASREPVAVEVDLETPVAGLVVRCRVDAVFPRPADEGGGVDVVDWKTGRPPTGEAARAAAVQLAVYRLAWSRWKDVPLEQVGAAFFYAATGTTSRPADLLDARGLEALVAGTLVLTSDGEG
nr:ATP-dependent DNA helicase [Quadrisphaera sp. RL12-1S]